MALNIAMRVAMNNYKVGFWELEMQPKQLALRMQAAYDHELCRAHGYTIGAKLTYDMLRTHNITGEARERYISRDFSVLQENAKLFYDSNLTPEKLVHQMRLFVKRYPETRLFVIDHIGLLNLTTKNGENEVTNIGLVTKALKCAATDLGVDIIQLCQLNRGVEARTDKMPTMADARGSGRIEEDSDVILGLMRPFYYDPTADKTLLHIGALKNRQGVTGVFDVTIDLECCAIHDRKSV
jgi:replicative DNA helicase